MRWRDKVGCSEGSEEQAAVTCTGDRAGCGCRGTHTTVGATSAVADAGAAVGWL